MKHLWRYIFILSAIIILWNQFILRPVRILSIFFHKIGYSFIAFLFGYGKEAFSAAFENLGVTNTKCPGLVFFLFCLKWRVYKQCIVFCNNNGS